MEEQGQAASLGDKICVRRGCGKISGDPADLWRLHDMCT
jgi:hypothetical protein